MFKFFPVLLASSAAMSAGCTFTLKLGPHSVFSQYLPGNDLMAHGTKWAGKPKGTRTRNRALQEGAGLLDL